MKLHLNTEFYIDMVQFTVDEMGIKAIYPFDSLKPCDGRRCFFFKSDGLKKEGNKYILSQKIEAPYYQPLPAKPKRADGDYQYSKSTDGRFWNKIEFKNRLQSNIKNIETIISVEEKNGGAELNFAIKGTDDERVTIEFCFKEGGQLIGLKKLDDAPDNYTLESGTGEYKFGKDCIKFGEGTFKHSRLRELEGEM